MSRRQLIALLNRRLVRRLVIVPLTLLLTAIAVLFSPLLLLGALINDVRARRKPRSRVRIVALLIGALVIETIGIATSLVVWILTGFGFLGSPRWRWRMHRTYMGLYTNTMLKLIVRIVGTSIDWRDRADLSMGPVVLVARHTSFFDALIPATVLSRRNKLLAHHVVTHGLRYAPCIDIVGHRFPNRFISRSPGEGSSELPHIQAVGAVLDSGSAAIIFPEGTFRNPERFERVVRRLRRRQPEIAERAEKLAHVLPPRANGTHALLAGAPTADVVICTNTGLESFGSIKQIVDAPFANDPVIIETWRIARAEIPDDSDEFNTWLFEQFVRVDEWVEAQHDKRPSTIS